MNGVQVVVKGWGVGVFVVCLVEVDIGDLDVYGGVYGNGVQGGFYGLNGGSGQGSLCYREFCWDEFGFGLSIWVGQVIVYYVYWFEGLCL